jgi:hypothetical protein
VIDWSRMEAGWIKLNLSPPARAKLANQITEKLSEKLELSDSVLAEYIIVMLTNGKTEDQVSEDLKPFLGSKEEAAKFTKWLWNAVSLLQHENKERTDQKSHTGDDILSSILGDDVDYKRDTEGSPSPGRDRESGRRGKDKESHNNKTSSSSRSPSRSRSRSSSRSRSRSRSRSHSPRRSRSRDRSRRSRERERSSREWTDRDRHSGRYGERESSSRDRDRDRRYRDRGRDSERGRDRGRERSRERERERERERKRETDTKTERDRTSSQDQSKEITDRLRDGAKAAASSRLLRSAMTEANQSTQQQPQSSTTTGASSTSSTQRGKSTHSENSDAPSTTAHDADEPFLKTVQTTKNQNETQQNKNKKQGPKVFTTKALRERAALRKIIEAGKASGTTEGIGFDSRRPVKRITIERTIEEEEEEEGEEIEIHSTVKKRMGQDKQIQNIEQAKQEVEEEEEEEEAEEGVSSVGDATQKRKRCMFWPACTNPNCVYFHPTEQCKAFPNCIFGKKCLYIHPALPCKFGLHCTRPNCAYTHPPPVLAAAAAVRMAQKSMAIAAGPGHPSAKKPKTQLPPCRNGFACSTPGCKYLHPAGPCKFMKACTKGSACPFSHGPPCRYGAKCTVIGCTYAHLAKNPSWSLGQARTSASIPTIEDAGAGPFHRRTRQEENEEGEGKTEGGEGNSSTEQNTNNQNNKAEEVEV